MKLEHRTIDGTAMVSYLRDQQCNLKIGSSTREELEKAVIYIVGTPMREDEDGEPRFI